MYNFPQLSHWEVTTTLSFCTKKEDWIQRYQDVPDLAFIATIDYLQVILLLLKECPRSHEENWQKVHSKLVFDLNKGPNIK